MLAAVADNPALKDDIEGMAIYKQDDGKGYLVQCFAVEETRCPPPRPACRWQSPARAARRRTGSAWSASSAAASRPGRGAHATTAPPANEKNDRKKLDTEIGRAHV